MLFAYSVHGILGFNNLFGIVECAIHTMISLLTSTSCRGVPICLLSRCMIILCILLVKESSIISISNNNNNDNNSFIPL